jgi:hypothetical protein
MQLSLPGVTSQSGLESNTSSEVSSEVTECPTVAFWSTIQRTVPPALTVKSAGL